MSRVSWFASVPLPLVALLAGLTPACGGSAASPEVVARPLLGPNAVAAARDTTVRSATPNQNFGGESTLGANKALVGFSQGAIAALLPPGVQLGSARLELTIAANPAPRSRCALGAYRMTKDWTEAGATWNCAVDANPANRRADCSGVTAWNMAPFAPNPWRSPPTATVALSGGQTGAISFDVTADVVAFLQGAAPNFGWIIQSADGGAGKEVSFGARESAGPPRLVVTTACAAGFADCDNDPANGCEQSLSAPSACGACGVSCDDHNPCTADACDAHAGCVHRPVADGTACDDRNACTQSDTCPVEGG